MMKKLPITFKPLLWFLRWGNVDVKKDKEDIIVNTINEGTLGQWQWLIDVYGKKLIRNVLEKRLLSEFHPESINLAKIIFGIHAIKNTRRSAHN